MKRIAAINGVAIAITVLGISLVGCGSPSSSNSAANKTSSTSSTSATSKPQSKVAPRTTVPGPNPTIASYIQQSGITDTLVHRGDPAIFIGAAVPIDAVAAAAGTIGYEILTHLGLRCQLEYRGA